MVDSFDKTVFDNTIITELMASACINDYVDIIVVFYENMKEILDFNYCQPTQKNSLLHLCCENGSLDSMLFLLKNNCCDVLHRNKQVM